MLTVLDNYFWIVLILVTIGNAAAWRRRGSKHIAADPQLAPGYKRLTLGFALWGNIPWVVMGLGVVVGGVTTRDYLRPAEANPWVLSWYLTAFVLWGLLLWWVFLRGGALKLVAHPGFFNPPITKPKYVKALALAGVGGGVIGVALAFRGPMLVPYVTSQTDGYTTCFVVYDGFWRVVASALIYLLIGIAILIVSITWIRRLNLPKWWNRKEAGRPAFLLLWSIFWLSLSVAGFGYAIWKDTTLVGIYRSGNAQIIEGTVHLLHQQPASGHAQGDVLEVNGVQLVVDFYQSTTAYTQTVAHGGVLTEGTRARLWCSGQDILRVDVPREPSSKPVP